jgi:DNA sulfur modification protein DndD
MVSGHEDSLVSLREIRSNIQGLFELNDRIRSEVEKLQSNLEIEIEERNRIIGNSPIGESRLQDVLKNYNGWQKDLAKYLKDETDFNRQLVDLNILLKQKKDEKDKIDTEVANTFLIKTRAILRDICTIFKATREVKFDEFILDLQVKSNEFFAKINAGAFHGEIKFTRVFKNGRQVIDVDLQEEGKILYRPNQSLETSMHIAILFAISELASERNEEKYPLIFDAPTSSFGETKTGAFLNIIAETGNQIILLLKDFIVQDKESGTLSIKPEFSHISRDKAFWVKLERPFNPKDLTSINTEIITL